MKTNQLMNCVLNKRSVVFLVSSLICMVNAKSQLVMNGGTINMQNAAYLVVANSNANAITINSTSGGIVQDATSMLRWRIGSTAASYTIPFYYGGNYIPLSFTTASASGSGYFDLNTYNVPSWKNSDYLPQGVANVNRNGVDNSNRVIDRFWSINAEGYSVKPQLTNVVMTYRDVEWSAAGNIITEPSLKAQRWNSNLSVWHDYAPAGTANTGANTVTIASVAANDLFQWWTLVDAAFPLPLQLLSFQGKLLDKKVRLNWSTSMEVNTKEFIVERSSDRTRFVPIDTVGAAGNSSSIKNYSIIDEDPLQGVSYYRLKMVDVDGQFTYSPIAMIVISGTQIVVYPNPATDIIHVELGAIQSKSYRLFASSGRLLKTGMITNSNFTISLSGFARGTYLLQIQTDNGVRNFSIIKS